MPIQKLFLLNITGHAQDDHERLAMLGDNLRLTSSRLLSHRRDLLLGFLQLERLHAGDV